MSYTLLGRTGAWYMGGVDKTVGVEVGRLPRRSVSTCSKCQGLIAFDRVSSLLALGLRAIRGHVEVLKLIDSLSKHCMVSFKNASGYRIYSQCVYPWEKICFVLIC